MKGGISQVQVADGSRPGALAAGLVALAFLTLFPCAGYAQSESTVRELILQFETLENEALTEAQVVAGRTTEVQVVLTNPDLLEFGETVTVTLTAAAVSVVPPVVTLAEATPRITLSIEAAVDAVAGGTVEATGVVLSGGSAVENTSVGSATLTVSVARRFRLSVSPVSRLSGAAFAREKTPAVGIPDNGLEQSVRSTISVVEDITVESLAVAVSISHTYIGDLLVILISPGGTEVVLHDRSGVNADDIRQVYMSSGNAGLASLTGERARGDWILTVGDYEFADVGRLESWGLYVNPSSTIVQVVAGGSASVLVELAGMETPFGRARLLPGETVSVTLMTAETVNVVPPMVTLTETAPGITLSIEAAVDAVSGGTVEARGVVLSDGSVVENTSVSPATLAIEVVPRRFGLWFGTPEGAVLEVARVVAGSTTEVAVALTAVAGALEPGETISVTLTAEGVDVSTNTVVLSMTMPTAVLTIGAAVSATSGTLTAVADITGVMNAVVEPATLAVTVVPAPPVDLQLAFDPPALTVAVGRERTAVLRLSGVPVDTEVTAALSATNTAIAEVMPESVTFTATIQSRAVTVTGEAEGSATVTAVMDVSSGLPAGSTVASAELVVTVVPELTMPVTLTLVFDPTSLTVAVGRLRTAVLRLSDVPEGTEVAVTVVAADATTARVLSESVVFDAEMSSRDVTVLGVAAGDVAITASVDADALARSLPEGSTVAPAQLEVLVKEPGLRLHMRVLLEGPLQ